MVTRDQVDRGFYEFMFGADLLLRQRERLAGRLGTAQDRRRALVPRLIAALAGDPFVSCEEDRTGLNLIIRPGTAGAPEVRVPMIELR